MSFASVRLAVMGLAVVASAGLAQAQGGSCKDPWINQAYNQLYHRAPSGSGASGECNTALYGGGHWTTYADLTSKVVAVKGLPSASQAAHAAPASPAIKANTTNPILQLPSASAGRSSVPIPEASAVTAARHAQLTQYHVDMGGNLVGPAGLLLARSGQFLISASIVAQGGGNIVAQGGGNIVAQGGGNVVPSAGMLINAASSNFVVGR